MPNTATPETWRVKTVEHIRPSTRDQRQQWIEEAGFNLFTLPSDRVFIDLLTDSGTGAMSDRQWAAIMSGDESYAGSTSFHALHEVVQDLFGLEYLLPVHQGRAAENALFSVLVHEDQLVPANSHFDTTRAHIEFRKAAAVDCLSSGAYDVTDTNPFKGNMNLDMLRDILQESHARVPFILLTITCNTTGGQPVSLANIAAVKALADRYHKPLVVDAARFAENAWFIQQREPGYRDTSLRDITRQMLGMADAMVMSAKKDGLVNIGGFLATRHREWFDQATEYVILFEGFRTYGGLAGRDLAALAVGLEEVISADYLASRIGQVQRFGQRLIDAGVPIQQPVGGHAVLVDASRFLPEVPREEYVAQTLAVELYLEAGVRGVEIGTLLNGRDPESGEERFAETEWLRLAIPRRVYSNDHLEYVAQALIDLYHRRSEIRAGVRIVEEKPVLRHFTVRLERKTE
ncbi:tryptophanase [Aspergillus saccharolyticus JOP 1030-1]|uniref:Tryptophanase n=1 Tax=Aspergillus saccharolyticus JOP 1030-1 TaxID=1450539 RepID=A0A318Z208_9EURO|nr:Tryptophanase [Aspergillus saccharolyticus JOP 1030-1]PYH41086.1 Tryptophanase [Aspergillus saccharolyticus JOP 1030-1]